MSCRNVAPANLKSGHCPARMRLKFDVALAQQIPVSSDCALGLKPAWCKASGTLYVTLFRRCADPSLTGDFRHLPQSRQKKERISGERLPHSRACRSGWKARTDHGGSRTHGAGDRRSETHRQGDRRGPCRAWLCGGDPLQPLAPGGRFACRTVAPIGSARRDRSGGPDRHVRDRRSDRQGDGGARTRRSAGQQRLDLQGRFRRDVRSCRRGPPLRHSCQRSGSALAEFR